jgi:hypothetical protein
MNIVTPRAPPALIRHKLGAEKPPTPGNSAQTSFDSTRNRNPCRGGRRIGSPGHNRPFYFKGDDGRASGCDFARKTERRTSGGQMVGIVGRPK